jgi:uncharacterized caspase-like protein
MENAATFGKICKKAQTAPFFFSGHGGGLDGKTVLAAIDFRYDGKMGTSARRPKGPRYTPAKDGFGI